MGEMCNDCYLSMQVRTTLIALMQKRSLRVEPVTRTMSITCRRMWSIFFRTTAFILDAIMQ